MNDQPDGGQAPPSVRPVDLRDYASFNPDRPVRVRVLATEVLTVDLWCLEPGQTTEALCYPEVDVAYTVLGGQARFVTDEGEIGLGPLGAILVPADVVHAIDNSAADPLVVLAAASPPDVPATEVATDEPVDPSSRAVILRGEQRGLLDRLRGLLGDTRP